MLKPFEDPIYVVRPVLPDFDDYVSQLSNVFDSKWLTNEGPKSKLLTEKLVEKLGVEFISLFCNGTLALQLACKALNLTGEVITTPFTFPATPHSLSWNRLKPVFCDIEEETFNLDVNKIEYLINENTSAIMPVHVFGSPCEVYRIQEIADKYGLKVIYDAAHAFGVKVDGIPIGRFGDMSMFSFHATKLFSTVEGGALTFSNSDLVQSLYYLKNFGIKNEEEVVEIGSNAKMNELQAAFGLITIHKVDEEIRKRHKLTMAYRDGLKDIVGIRFLKDLPGVDHNYQYMPILIDEEAFGISRDLVYERLKDYNVFARRYFYPLCSQLACYKNLDIRPGSDLKVAEKITKQVLCLPLYGDLREEDVFNICKILASLTTISRSHKQLLDRVDKKKSPSKV